MGSQSATASPAPARDNASAPALLAASPPQAGFAPVAPRFLDRPDGRIAYDDAGSGALVVMVPGIGDIRQEYRALVPILVAAGYRAVTMDIRGHGQSSADWPDYSASALGGDIVALVRGLDAGPAALIGTSMGAAAVASAAVLAPGLAARLVLIGPFVRDIPAASRFKAAMQALSIRLAFGGPWAPWAWAAYMATLYPSRKPDDWPAYRRRLVAMLREPGRARALRAMLRAGREDVEPHLGKIGVPALVLMGTRDPDFADPAAEAATVARLVGGEAAMIEGAGHYPHAEMPEEASAAILAFLRGGTGA